MYIMKDRWGIHIAKGNVIHQGKVYPYVLRNANLIIIRNIQFDGRNFMVDDLPWVVKLALTNFKVEVSNYPFILRVSIYKKKIKE